MVTCNYERIRTYNLMYCNSYKLNYWIDTTCFILTYIRRSFLPDSGCFHYNLLRDLIFLSLCWVHHNALTKRCVIFSTLVFSAHFKVVWQFLSIRNILLLTPNLNYKRYIVNMIKIKLFSTLLSWESQHLN